MQDSADTRITPFWHRIPRFFLYPLHPTSLIMMVLFSLGAMIFSFSLFGVFVLLAGTAVFLKYCYYILEHTAQGHNEPPSLSWDFLSGDYMILLKQLGVFMLLGLLASVLGGLLGPFGSTLVILIGGLLIPASIMILAVTNSFSEAINPSSLSRLVGEIGWPYLILYGFLFFLNVGQETAMYFLSNLLPPGLLIAGLAFVTMYFTYIMYNMMGYVIYQFHDRLGYSVIDEQDDETRYENMGAVEQFIAQENFAAAAEELKSIIRANPDDPDLRLKFHKLVKLENNTKQMLVHGDGLITRLLVLNRKLDAMTVYLDCVTADPAFRPSDKDTYLPLAQLLRAHKQQARVIQLLNGFHKRFPNDPLVPQLYLFVAQVFIDDLSQDTKARPILEYLAKAFPDHPLSEQVMFYRTALKNVKS